MYLLPQLQKGCATAVDVGKNSANNGEEDTNSDAVCQQEEDTRYFQRQWSFGCVDYVETRRMVRDF